jgi:Tfp pilus assembly protein PilF
VSLDGANLAKAMAAVDRGRYNHARGDQEAAAYFFIHSLEWADTAEGRLGWAQSLSYQGKLDEAVAECKKAMALQPDLGQACNDMGVYLMQLGQDDLALDWFKRALEAPTMPERQFPHYNMGRIYERRQEFGLAFASYQAAVKLQEDFDSANLALDRVRRRLV